jgi:DNA-binding MarR family transcriptional regulator
MTTPPGDAVDAILSGRAAHWPQAATPVSQVMVRIFRLSGLVLDGAARRVAAHGLTFKEFEVLATLRGTPPPHELLPSALYGAALISSGGLTKVLHGLEERGLVARGADKADRRSKPVRLTARGRRLAERSMADVLAADGAMIAAALSEGEAARLVVLLRKLLVEIEARSR